MVDKEEITMDNLTLYNSVRTVPKEAQKPIVGGRMSGKTDINPMWRLKTLTEQFGPCGIGWKYSITKQWLEKGGNDEIAAFCNIELFIKWDGQWSEAIPGTGGSSFVAKEKNGMFTSDECFKMALTDAISVACKALGFGADIYWEKDSSKYDKPTEDTTDVTTLTEKQINRVFAIAKSKGYNAESVKKAAIKKYSVTEIKNLTKEQYDEFCKGYEGLPNKEDK